LLWFTLTRRSPLAFPLILRSCAKQPLVWAPPGTPQLAAVIAPLIPEYEAILLANHGVVTYTANLLCAYQKMELVEHFAMIALVTELLGHQQLLHADELDKLGTARKKQLHKA
jgi:L-fuculose-phosphate aldolase